ncbi:MAG TPA: hypothetical protein VL172_20685 [Kofleriaceae bacterium]|nr:hypothetical protein [Kofleriaceae bacterium]
MRIWLCTLLTALTLLAAPAAAQPQPPPPKKAPTEADRKLAEEKLRSAAEMYARGDRLGAVPLFEEAYGIYPTPIILYNLGKAYHGVGRNGLAHRTLARYLREDKAIKPERKAEVDRLQAELEQVVGLIDVEVSANGVQITVDGDEVGTAPLPGAVAVEPGVHLVVAIKDGKELASRQVAVGTGKRVTAQLAFIAGPEDDSIVKPRDNHPLVPPPHGTGTGAVGDDDDDLGLGVQQRHDDRRGGAPIYKKWWFWTGIGVAVVAASVFAITRDRGTINDLDPSLGIHNF